MTAESSRQNILIIKLGALGDFIQALGPIAAIRRHHPNANITLLTTQSFEKMARRCPYFDEIWIDKKPKTFDLSGWLCLRKQLIEGRFERIYDLQNNDRTFLYFRLFPRSKRPEWVGAVKGASHSNRSPDRSIGHALEGHIQTLALGGINDIEIDDLSWINEDISHLSAPPSYALIVAGCAPQHLHKRWPAKHYAEIGNILVNDGITPLLLGTSAETEINASISALCPAALNLTNRTSIFEIAVLARNAMGAIGNDTGPMHLIAATGCPTTALFSGASHKVKHAPRGRNVVILQEENLENLSVERVKNTLFEQEILRSDTTR